jgi:hypothetical protein
MEFTRLYGKTRRQEALERKHSLAQTKGGGGISNDTRADVVRHEGTTAVLVSYKNSDDGVSVICISLPDLLSFFCECMIFCHHTLVY